MLLFHVVVSKLFFASHTEYCGILDFISVFFFFQCWMLTKQEVLQKRKERQNKKTAENSVPCYCRYDILSSKSPVTQTRWNVSTHSCRTSKTASSAFKRRNKDEVRRDEEHIHTSKQNGGKLWCATRDFTCPLLLLARTTATTVTATPHQAITQVIRELPPQAAVVSWGFIRISCLPSSRRIHLLSMRLLLYPHHLLLRVQVIIRRIFHQECMIC